MPASQWVPNVCFVKLNSEQWENRHLEWDVSYELTHRKISKDAQMGFKAKFGNKVESESLFLSGEQRRGVEKRM